MKFIERMRERRREKRVYDRLLWIAAWESNNGTPWEPSVGMADTYFAAGEYEQYFADLGKARERELDDQRRRLGFLEGDGAE